MKRVLFLCTGNSCRSQMAEVFLRSIAGDRFEVLSAGALPAGHVHPMALEILRQAKLPTEGLRSKSWEEFKGQSMNFVITVCDRTKESCPVWPGQPVTAHWGFEDPVHAQGTEEERWRVFKKVFIEIQARVRLFASLPMEKLTHLELEKSVRAIGQSLPTPT